MTDTPPYTAKPGDYHADAQTLHARQVRDDLLTQLSNMTADLQGHIERRAAELAQPLIAKAREDAAVEVKSAQGMQQRAEDLNTELRRQLRPLGRQVDHYKQRAETAEAAIVKTQDHLARNLTGLVGKSGFEVGYRACAEEVTGFLDGASRRQEADRG